MAESEPPPLDRRSVSDDKERSRILEDVLRDQARREVLRDVAYRRPSSSLRTRIVAAALALVAAILWSSPIPGLKPEIPFTLPPIEEDTGLRLAAFIQAQQVEAFRRISGRLPDVLRETGEPLPGIDYERLDAHTYRLRGWTERDTINWVSSDSLPALLGDSATERLREIAR
jgi:hypothetical protein